MRAGRQLPASFVSDTIRVSSRLTRMASRLVIIEPGKGEARHPSVPACQALPLRKRYKFEVAGSSPTPIRLN